MADVMTSVIVTQAVAANLREICRRMGKVDLNGMLVSKLSATGNLPATHYISSGLIRPAFLNAMTNNVRLYNAARQAWKDDGDVFPYTQAQVTSALSSCTIHDGTFNGQPEGPHALIARLGLQLVQEPI